MNVSSVAKKSRRRSTTTPPSRIPCHRFDYTDSLATKFQAFRTVGMNCEAAFSEVLFAFDNFIYQQSAKLQSIRGKSCSYEDANSEVIARIFELLIDFDLEQLRFSAYLKLKLGAWVNWEALRMKRRRKELMVSLPTHELQDLCPSAEVTPSFREVRHKLSNYCEATSDLLFLRHILSFTQAEIGEVLNVHQFTVGLHLRSAHAHLNRSTSFNGNGHANGDGHNGNSHNGKH